MSAHPPKEAEEEAFDLYDAEGRPLGRSKARSRVHREGDWHRSLHLWVLVEGESGPELVLQRRSLSKDTWPGALDLSVTGHYRAGDTLGDALREADEELGLPLREEQVQRLGTRFRVDRARPPIVDREIQDILCVRVALPFEELRPDPGELDAILALGLGEAGALFEGRDALGVSARCLQASTRRLSRVELRSEELVHAPDGYYALAWRQLLLLLEGASPSPFRLGPPV